MSKNTVLVLLLAIKSQTLKTRMLKNCTPFQHIASAYWGRCFCHRNDLYCVGWAVKLHPFEPLSL